MAVSVLIVEDDRNIAELLQMYLEKEGYAVTVAADGGQGLAKFRAIKPDLVLLDVMMPVMDGWSVCKAIRAEAQTPIIMLTAKGDTDSKVMGLKTGADDYITKPFEMKEVLARIEAARLEGLSEIGIFFRMFVPIMRSTYGAAMTVTFMNAWNSYLWPKIVFQSNASITMPMLVANLKSGYSVDYGMLMLGVLICTLPTAIIFLCLQKSFANGITGAVK